MSNLRDHVAVVTGAGRGMGRAIARAFAERGATVIAVARTSEDLRVTAAGIEGSGTVVVRPADVSRPGEVTALFRDVVQAHGGVDILVCSHGIYQGGQGALDLPLEQFDLTMTVNLRSCLQCAQLAGRSMRERSSGGRIVFISSMNGSAAQSGAIDYDTSKAALNGLTRALAVELAGDRITVNAVAPGWVRTSMSEDELRHLQSEGLVMNPLGQIGDPQDIALAVLWLTDPANGFTTGTVIPVDGGQLAMLGVPWRPGAVLAPPG